MEPFFTATESFGQRHFGAAQLGHRDRTARLVDVADRMAAHPAGSLPEKLRDRTSLRGLYRLARQPRVTHAAVLKPHADLTHQRARDHTGPVLFVHDITELDYTSKRALRNDLGPIGDGRGRGYECFNSLVVDPATTEVFGLAHQILHKRAKVPPKESVAAKRARASRESRLWLKATSASGRPPEGATWVDIADRGGDTFEFLEGEQKLGRGFVVRASHNRRILIGHDPGAAPGKLKDYARTLPRQLGRTVGVGATATQPARAAHIEVGLAPIQVVAPHVRRGEHGRQPLPLWALHAVEVGAPPGVTEPLEWFLYVGQPLGDAAAAAQALDWYECRPLIEEYHKCQKTGVGIEGPQLKQGERLEPVIALLSVVALLLLNLRAAGRQADAATRPAAEVVPEVYVRVLSVWQEKGPRRWSVAEFIRGLGRLGGHQGRKGDGMPGWQTLWRGWGQLQAMVEYEEARTAATPAPQAGRTEPATRTRQQEDSS